MTEHVIYLLKNQVLLIYFLLVAVLQSCTREVILEVKADSKLTLEFLDICTSQPGLLTEKGVNIE